MKLSDLEHWPVYDTPYEVEDAFGTYIEVIEAGAADAAVPLGAPGMIVTEDEWSEDHSRRIVRRISALGPR